MSSSNQVTVPRLELCGAVLLAKLFHHVARILELPLDGTFVWMDSLVAFEWLQGSPQNLKTFVGNRVSTIMELIPPDRWHRVSGKENPADCASRGILPPELQQHKLWWKGPQWLEKSREDWPAEPIVMVSELLEEKDHMEIAMTVFAQPASSPLLNTHI